MSVTHVNKTCLIQTSWNVEENLDITDVVVYRFEDGDDDNRSLACPCGLHLRAPCAMDVPQGSGTNQSAAPCTVTVSQADQEHSYVVSAVDVLCSAKFMELYSSRGEYWCTSEGVRIDGEVVVSEEDDDQKLYCLQHSFDTPVVSFSLKFLGLTQTGRLWLHSLHITVSAGSGHSVVSLMSSAMGTNVDWEKVRQLTSEVSGEIPEKARQLWKSVETTQKKRESSISPLGSILGVDSGAPSMPPVMAAMMSMFAGMNTRHSSSHPNVKTEHIAMVTGNDTEVRSCTTMEGAVSHASTGDHNVGKTVGMFTDSSHHGYVTHKTSELSNSATRLKTNHHSNAGSEESERGHLISGATCDIGSANSGATCDSALELLSSGGTGANAPSTNVMGTTSCIHCGGERPKSDLRDLEDRLKRYVSEAEMRIVTVLGRRLDDAQRETSDKLDTILRHVMHNTLRHNYGVTDNSISLD